jgi:hypothetical protein
MTKAMLFFIRNGTADVNFMRKQGKMNSEDGIIEN